MTICLPHIQSIRLPKCIQTGSATPEYTRWWFVATLIITVVNNQAASLDHLGSSSAQPVQAWILVRDIRASAAFSGGTGAVPSPAPPVGDLPACTDYNEFHQLSL